MNGILLRIFNLKAEMTNKEIVVANSLLNDPSAIITRSITEYAAYTSSSPATLTRFCKRLGLSGFSELRLSVANSLTNERCDIGGLEEHVDLESTGTNEELMAGVISNAISSITQLHKLVSPALIEEAAALISNARYILLTGIGASALVAMDLHQKLTRVGILSYFDTDLDLQKVQLASFCEKDVVIAFSYSGMKEEIKSVCKIAREKKSKIIAVTKLGVNPISSMADVHIPVVPSEALVREGATVSRLQMLVVVDFIYQFIMHSRQNVFDKLIETWTNVSV